MNTTPTPTEKSEAAPKSAATNPAPKKEPILKVRVLVPKLTIAGGTAAKNARLNVAESAAKYHEDRKEVEILGTA